MKLNLLLLLALSQSPQVLAAGIQTDISCVDENRLVSVDISFKEDNAISKWDLKMTINRAEMSGIKYESLLAGKKIVGRYITFKDKGSEHSLTILDNEDSSYANATSRVNGLLVWKRQGERENIPVVCAASSSDL
jgi:hypothetical protein